MEIMDIVDQEDNVIGSCDKNEIYSKKLRHRIAHVLIFNEKDEIALQLRSGTVSFCPGYWSTTVGGHVRSGETHKEAASREMEEEIGIILPIKPLSKDFYQGNGLQKILGIFTAVYCGPFSPDKNDVEAVKFFSIEKIKKMIKKGEKIHPELLFILEKHFSLS